MRLASPSRAFSLNSVCSGPSFYNLDANQGGNQLDLGFDQGGGALARLDSALRTSEILSALYTPSPGRLLKGRRSRAPFTWGMMILGFAGAGFHGLSTQAKASFDPSLIGDIRFSC
jgi:hypothetical protein